MAECKLCGKVVKKLVRCHIYPAAMTREVAGGSPLLAFHSTGHLSIARDGIFDREIVCGACEDLFGRADDYAINFRRGVLRLEIPFRLKHHTYRLPTFQADAEALHLFAMQTLLRASISSRPECAQIDNPELVEEVKGVFFQGRTSLSFGREVGYVFARHELAGFLTAPMFRALPKNPVYELKMPHMVIWVSASNAGLPRGLNALTLRPGSEVTVWRRRRPLDIELGDFQELYDQQSERVDRIFSSFKTRK